MRIRIADFLLAGDSELAPDSLTIDAERQVQIVQRLRALASKPIARANTLTTISFTVTREHDHVRAAETYLLKHEADIPATGQVTFECEGDDGVESRFAFDAAELKTTSARQIGVSTLHSYTLIGGRIEDLAP